MPRSWRQLSVVFTLSALLGLCAGAVSAAQAGPLEGRWASSPAACSADDDHKDGLWMVVKGMAMEGLEWSCTIQGVTPIGGQSLAWRMGAACVSEEHTSTMDAIFALDRDENGQTRSLIEIDMTEGWVRRRVPCP